MVHGCFIIQSVKCDKQFPACPRETQNLGNDEGRMRRQVVSHEDRSPVIPRKHPPRAAPLMLPPEKITSNQRCWFSVNILQTSVIIGCPTTDTYILLPLMPIVTHGKGLELEVIWWFSIEIFRINV